MVDKNKSINEVIEAIKESLDKADEADNRRSLAEKEIENYLRCAFDNANINFSRGFFDDLIDNYEFLDVPKHEIKELRAIRDKFVRKTGFNNSDLRQIIDRWVEADERLNHIKKTESSSQAYDDYKAKKSKKPFFDSAAEFFFGGNDDD